MKKIRILQALLLLVLTAAAFFLLPFIEKNAARTYEATFLMVSKPFLFFLLGVILSLPDYFRGKFKANVFYIVIEVLLLAGLFLYPILIYSFEVLYVLSCAFGYFLVKSIKTET